MKVSFITPTSYIKEYGSQGQFIMALSHLLDIERPNGYEKAVKRTKLPIILDNGVFEKGQPEDMDSLTIKALNLKAWLAYCPDYLYDKEKTEKEIDRAYPYFKERNIKMGAIVQASKADDYLKLYDKFVEDERISLIGLSYLAIYKSFGGSVVGARIKLLKELLKRKNKDCHLLGASEGYEDMLFAKANCPFVKYHDSSSAFWNAMQGKVLVELMTGSVRVEGGKTKVPVDFNFKSATKEQLELAQKNINLIKEKLCN